MKMTPEDLAALRALSLSGAVTMTELCKVFPDVQVTRIERLYAHGLASRQCIPHKPDIWQISGRGRTALTRVDAPVGEIVGAAYRPSAWEPYTGMKPIATRPGSMDAFAHPSRTGDKLTPHRLPISLSAAGDSVVAGEDE